MPKKLVTNFIFLLFIVAFVVGFKSLFGELNILIGVTTITTILMFMSYDLSVRPVRNFLKLLLINIAMAIVAHLTLYNMYLGLVLNLVMIFTITYAFYNSYKMDMCFPYLLQYAFILFTPVAIEEAFFTSELLLRGVSLMVGPILIIVMHLLLNRKHIHERRINHINDMINSFSKFIEDPSNEEFSDAKVRIKGMIYNSGETGFVSSVDTIILNCLMSLENISYNIENYTENDKRDLREYLEILQNQVDKREMITVKYESYSNKNLINNIKIIQNNLIKNKMKIDAKTFFKTELKKISIGKSSRIFLKNLTSKYSIESTFALKVSLAFSLAFFFTQFFNFSEGKWAIFTIISVFVPLYEKSSSKIKDRLFATVVGSLLVSLLFYFITDSTLRVLVIMGASYINMFMNQYRHKMIFVTISAIGAATLTATNPATAEFSLALTRIIMVILGVGVGITFNRLIFPYTLQKSICLEEEKYTITMNRILEEFKKISIDKSYSDSMKFTIMYPELIKNTVDKNIKECGGKDILNPIDNLHMENVNLIYHFYNCLKYSVIPSEKINEIISKVESIKNYSFDESDELGIILNDYYIK